MGRKGDCYDNAATESFFSNLKNELVWSADFKTRAETRSAIFEWIGVFYHREQLLATLDDVNPVRYEARVVVP